MTESNENIIHADPSKEFFIGMLTRDITVTQCILDLVDNSIHNFISDTDIDVMDLLLGKEPPRGVNAEVKIQLSKNEFRISDTCGGITIADAREEVFLFGNPTHEREHSGLGVYGIGMKRAFFKLGRFIRVESQTSDEEFAVEIDVDEWERKKLWDLEFKYARPFSGKGKAGTTIIVNRLYDPISRLFEQAFFQKELIRKLGVTYALFLKTGLKISMNGTQIKAQLPELKQSENLTSARQFFKSGGVDILVLAGVTPREDRQPYGWYVFCNGRMVVEADQTSLTGWGDDLPQYHTKYNHFLGMVYFRSADLLSLPWTTTKDGVERESPVFQKALGQMRVLAKPVLGFLSDMYAPDIAIEGREQLELMQAAGRISVEDLAKSPNRTWNAQPKPRKKDEQVTITYKKPLKQVEQVKVAFGKARMSNKEIGERTFDYFLRKEGQ